MRHDIEYKANEHSEQKQQAKPNASKPKKRKTQTQLMLEAAERNKLERKEGKSPTLQIFC